MLGASAHINPADVKEQKHNTDFYMGDDATVPKAHCDATLGLKTDLLKLNAQLLDESRDSGQSSSCC